MSTPRESPLDVAAYNVISCHWLAEPICTSTRSTRIQALCLSAALTPVWLGPAPGLGTPQSYGGQPVTKLREAEHCWRMLQEGWLSSSWD